jgi:ankyrin repeat protein
LYDTVLEFDVVSVIIDALDESQERESLLHIIGEMMKWKSETLHLLVASRDEVDIAARFSEMLTEPLETFARPLQTHVVDGDIQSYVQAQLATSQALSKWKRYKDLQLSTIEKLREAKEMYVFPYASAALVKCFILTKNRFRWAVCQLDALAKCRTRAQIKITLSELPKTLYETYDRMLQQIPEADARCAHRLLQWLAFSTQHPLQLSELAVAVAFDPELEAAFGVEDVMEDIQDVLSICGSLVTMIRSPWQTTEHVALAHYSVKEYLVSEHIAKFSPRFALDADSSVLHMAQSSLQCLKAFGSLYFDTTGTSLAFYHYCLKCWIRIVSMVGDNVHCLQELLLSFLRSLAYSKLLNIGDHQNLLFGVLIDSDSGPMDGACQGILAQLWPSPVYLAASQGWLYVFCSLLNQAVPNSVEMSSIKGNPLHTVFRRGNIPFIELLLRQYGVDLNSKGLWHHTALQAAAHGGHLKAVQILLNAGADVNDVGGEMDSPLQAASSQGRLRIVEELLHANADVNVRGGHYGSALQAAAARKHSMIVQTLLYCEAEVNACRVRLEKPFTSDAACEHHQKRGEERESLRGHSTKKPSDVPKLPTIVLSGSSHPTHPPEDFRSALQWSVHHGDMTTLSLLLRHPQVIVDIKSGRGTLYTEAASMGHIDILRVLIAHHPGGVHTVDLWAPIHAAAGYPGDNGVKMMELLIEHNVDLNAQDPKGSTALYLALISFADDFKLSISSRWEVVRLLLSHVADPNIANHMGKTPLHRQYNEDVTLILLKYGADHNVQDTKGRTPLHYAIDLKSMKLLLDHGARANMVDKKGGTPLHFVLDWTDPIEKYYLPLRSDVNIDAADYKGRTALHHLLLYSPRYHLISGEKNWELTKHCLKFNPSLNVQDDMGRTALDCALALGLSDIIDLLKANGAISTDAEPYYDSELSWGVEEDDYDYLDYEKEDKDHRL